MIKACIFDMDGTVSDTINSITYFGNKALAENGLSGFAPDDYKYMVGNGANILVRRMLEKNGCTDEALYKKVLMEYNESYDSDFLYLTAPYDGILPLLDDLRAAGIRTGVLSNKPHETTLKVAEALFGDRLDLCFGQREGKPIKPDPTVLKEMLSMLGITPDECLYAGDTATDMQTGKGAGCFTVGVLWGFRTEKELRDNRADAIVQKPAQILELIKEKNGK